MDLSLLVLDKAITPLDDTDDIFLGRDGLSCETSDTFVNGNQEVITDLYDREVYVLAKF